MPIDFGAAFKALTGYDPFGWQQRLFEEILAGVEHEACDIPTGLGKTSVIPIWLIALAAHCPWFALRRIRGAYFA